MRLKRFHALPALSVYLRALMILLFLSVPAMSKSAQNFTPDAIDSQTAGNFTVYVWNSQPLLDQSPTDSTFWKNCRVYGINRLLVSFNGRQLKALARRENKINLSRFISRADKQHIRVELLLGEPLWILPTYRPNLIEIINQLKDIQFSGLHLDLELNQLDQNRHGKAYLEAEWLRTLQAVKRVSPWPVGVSLHPRYIDPKKNRLCLGYALSGLEVNEVTLMIYVANPIRVAQIALPILRQYPGLSISIAQSVEPILSVEESYASQGRKQFQSRMEALRISLAPAANFTTIAIQSWKDLLRMAP